MTNRRNEVGDLKTNPGAPDDVDASEDANTAVINPPSESQPTAPIPAEIKGTAPAPRLKTAPYMIFDAVSAKDPAARKNPALHATTSEQLTAPGVPEDLAGTVASRPGASPTIPGPGPKAPGASPKSSREILPVKGPEPISMNGSNANDDAGPPRRVVSATGAFVGGILAIAIVAAGAVGGFIVKSTHEPAPAPTIPAASTTAPPPSTPPAASQTATTKSTSSPAASASASSSSASISSSASASESTPPPPADEKLPKESGNKPSKQSLDRMLAAVKPALTACVKGQAKALYSVKITFDPATGKPTDAQTFVPLTKTVAGGCVLGASYDARVNPYNGPPFTAEVKFAP